MVASTRPLKIKVTHRATRHLSAIWQWNADHYDDDHADGYIAFLKACAISSIKNGFSRSIAGRDNYYAITIRRPTARHGHVAIYRLDGSTAEILGFTIQPKIGAAKSRAENSMKMAMTVTDNAFKRVQALMARAPAGALGLRVGVKARGCSGLAYTIDYATTLKKFEDSVEQDGIKIFIDPPATMFLIGTEMDYEDTPLESKFIFRNPNERGRCGCGESFTVDAEKAAIAAGTLEKDENDNCG